MESEAKGKKRKTTKKAKAKKPKAAGHEDALTCVEPTVIGMEDENPDQEHGVPNPEQSCSSAQLLEMPSETEREPVKSLLPPELVNAPWFWEGPQHFDGTRLSTACLFAAANSSATFQLDKSFVVATRIKVPSSSDVDGGDVGGRLFHAECVDFSVNFRQASPDDTSVVCITFSVGDGLSTSRVEHKMPRDSLEQEGQLDICGTYWNADEKSEVRLYINEELQQQKDASHLEQTLPFTWPTISHDAYGYKGDILRVRVWPVTYIDGVRNALVDKQHGNITRMRWSFSKWLFARKRQAKRFQDDVVEKFRVDVVLKVVFQFLVFYADVITDLLTIASFFSMGGNFAIYGYITLFILFVSPVTCWLVLWTSDLASLKDLGLAILQLTVLIESLDFLKRWRKAAEAGRKLHFVDFPKPGPGLIWMALCEAVFEATSSSILQLYAAMEICLSFIQHLQSGSVEDVLAEMATLSTVFRSIAFSFLSISKAVTAFSFYGRHPSASAFANAFLQNLLQIVSRMTSIALLAMVFRNDSMGGTVALVLLVDWFLQLLLLAVGARQLLRNGMKKSMFLFWSLFMLVIAPPALIPQLADLHPIYFSIRVFELVALFVVIFIKCSASENPAHIHSQGCGLVDFQSQDLPSEMTIILVATAISGCGVVLTCLKSWVDHSRRASQAARTTAEHVDQVRYGERMAFKAEHLPNRFLQAPRTLGENAKQWRQPATSPETSAHKRKIASKDSDARFLWMFMPDEDELDHVSANQPVRFGDVVRIASMQHGFWLTGGRRGGNEYVDTCDRAADEKRWSFDYDIDAHYRWRVLACVKRRPDGEARLGQEVCAGDSIALQTLACPDHFLSLGRGPSDTNKRDVKTVPLVGGAAEEDSPELCIFPSFCLRVMRSAQVDDSEQVKREQQERKEVQARRVAMVAAAREMDVMMMSLMMVSGISFNVCNQQGLTPVHEFILRNSDQERHENFFLNMLQRADLSIGAFSMRYTALHLACLLGRRKFGDALIEHRANVNSADADGWTCLHDAIRFFHPEVVAYLLSKDGINVNAPSKDGLLPLDLALQCGNVDAAKLLQSMDATSKHGRQSRGSRQEPDPSAGTWQSRIQLCVKFVVPSQEPDWDPRWICEMDNGSVSSKPLVLLQDGKFLCIYCARSAAQPFQHALCKQYQCPGCDNIARIPYQESSSICWACHTCGDYPHQVRMEPGRIEDTSSKEAAMMAQAIFNQLDINKDGYITVDELQVIADGDAAEAKAVLEAADENQDGKLSLEEFKRLIS